MSHVFISHASVNYDVAERICQLIEAQGVKCWIAPRDIRAGHEYALEIMEGIAQCSAMVLVLTTPANDSTFVKREVERAVSRKKPVIPIRMEDVMPAPSLELFVSGSHWIDAWVQGLDAKAGELHSALASLGLGVSRPKETTSVESVKPTPGPGPSPYRWWVGGALAMLAVAGVGGGVWWAQSEQAQHKVAVPSPVSEPASTAVPVVTSPSTPAFVPAVAAPSSPGKQGPAMPVALQSVTPLASLQSPAASVAASALARPAEGVPGAAAQRTDPAGPAAPGAVVSHQKLSNTVALNDKVKPSGSGVRCAELLSKIGVGEPLSSHEQNEFNTSCH
jgi:hypothetical protein